MGFVWFYVRTNFKNIVVVSASIKELKWAENFILEYQHYLSNVPTNNVFIYSQAILEFYKGNFNIVSEHLQKLLPREYANKLSFKSLNIRNLYEIRCKNTSYISTLDSELFAFNKFLQRSELSSERIKAYQNFIYIVKKLNAAKSEAIISDKTSNKIQHELDKRKRIIARTWLEDKLRELSR